MQIGTGAPLRQVSESDVSAKDVGGPWGKSNLLNIGSFLRVDFQHTVDKRLQTLGVIRRRVFVLRIEHSHGYRTTLFCRLRVFEGRAQIRKGEQDAAQRLHGYRTCEQEIIEE